MASNIAVKITADVVDLQAKFAVAKAESQALTRELNSLAQQAAKAGGTMSAEMKGALTAAAEAALKAKAQVKALGDELNQGRGHAEIFKGGLDLIKGGLAALGITATIESLMRFGETVEENASHIAHEAQVLQLSVTSYQAFMQGAIDSGVATDIADNSIRKFTMSVGNAQEGMGPAAHAFIEMGISANQSNEALLQQVSTFLLHADAGTRARIAQELFGRGGVELLPTLEQWSQGVDNLTTKYDALNRMLDPGTAKAAEDADIKLSGAWESMKVKATPTVVEMTDKLTVLVGWLGKFNELSAAAERSLAKFNFGSGAISTQGPGTEALPKSKPVPPPKAPSEQDEITSLNALDSKLHERADLEKELAQAIKIRNDAAKANDGAGLKKASEAVADIQKQLDSLNKTSFGGGFKDAGAKAIAEAQVAISAINADQTKGDAERRAEIEKTYAALLNDTKLNTAQRLQVEKALNDSIAAANRQAANEKRQIDQNTAQTSLQLAQMGFDQQKAMLEEDVAAGRITKQEELSDLLPILAAEKQAKLDAVTQAQAGYAADTVFFKEKENEKKLIVAESEREIAQIRRQIQEQSARDEVTIEKRAYSEIGSASDTLISGLLSGRQTLLQTLGQATLQFVQKEIQDDAKYFLAHMLFSKEALASDQSLGQAGFLLHSMLETEKTTSTVANTAARAGVQRAASATENVDFVSRAVKWVASELGMTSATTAGEATRTAASAAAAAAAKAEQTLINSTAAESYAGVAAIAAASAVAGIPIIGPELAIAAATSTFAAMQPFAALAALDTGTNYVPQDMPAYIHEGERVVPKADNAAMIAAMGGVGSGGDTHNYNITSHVHPSGDIDMDRHAGEIVRIIKHQVRIKGLK